MKKLGATTEFDFAAAERKALEEEERVKKLGYDRKREEEEEKKRKEKQAIDAAAAKVAREKEIGGPAKTGLGAGANKTRVANVKAPMVQKASDEDLERLGMGMRKFGFGAVSNAAASYVILSLIRCVTMSYSLSPFIIHYTSSRSYILMVTQLFSR